MSIGVQPSKNDIDTFMTRVSKRLAVGFEELQQLKFWLDSKADADLVNYGYTAGEAAVIRSAFSDLDKLRQVWEGTAIIASGGAVTTGASGYDFRTFVKQLFGFGFDLQS